MKKIVLIVPLVLSMVLAGCKNTSDSSNTAGDGSLESILIGTWKSEWQVKDSKDSDFYRERAVAIFKQDRSCLLGYEHEVEGLIEFEVESDYDTYDWDIVNEIVKIFEKKGEKYALYTQGGHIINDTTMKWYSDGKEENTPKIFYKQ